MRQTQWNAVYIIVMVLVSEIIEVKGMQRRVRGPAGSKGPAQTAQGTNTTAQQPPTSAQQIVEPAKVTANTTSPQQPDASATPQRRVVKGPGGRAPPKGPNGAGRSAGVASGASNVPTTSNAFRTVTTAEGKEYKCKRITDPHMEREEAELENVEDSFVESDLFPEAEGAFKNLKSANGLGELRFSTTWDGASTLTIADMEAKDLKPMDKATGLSDPYVTLHLYNGAKELEPKFKRKTEIVKGQLCPIFRYESFTFNIKEDERDELNIVLKVWDWDNKILKLSRLGKDEFIGQVTIGSAALKMGAISEDAQIQWEATFDEPGKAADKWHQLRPRSDSGDILFSLVATGRGITIGLKEARDLANKDLVGKSDPYVRVILYWGTQKISVQETKHFDNNLNPQFNKSFDIDLKGQPIDQHRLVVQVLDKDKRKDDMIGEVVLSADDGKHRLITEAAKVQWRDMKQGRPVEQWHRLDREEPDLGTLTLGMKYNSSNETLSVTVKSARGLPVKDSKLNGGKADPYVRLALYEDEDKGLDRGHSIRVFRTKRIRNNLDPNWNETFTWKVTKSQINKVVLQVRAWDWDRFSADDLIAELWIGSDTADCKKITKAGKEQWQKMQQSSATSGYSGYSAYSSRRNYSSSYGSYSSEAEETYPLKKNRDSKLSRFKQWLKDRTVDSSSIKMLRFFQKIARGLHRFKYWLANSLFWKWLPKRVNDKLDGIARCVGYENGLEDVSTEGVKLKECHGLKRTFKLFVKLFAAKLRLMNPVPGEHVREILPCLKKYWGRKKLGVKEEEDYTKKNQQVVAAFGWDDDEDDRYTAQAKRNPIVTEYDDDESEYNDELAMSIENQTVQNEIRQEQERIRSNNRRAKRFVEPVSVVVITHTVYVGTLPVQACLPVIVLYWMIVAIYGLVFGTIFVVEVVAIGMAIGAAISNSRKKKKKAKVAIGDGYYNDNYPTNSPSYNDPYKYGYNPW